MVYIAQYDENQAVNGFMDEDNKFYPLVYQSEIESLGTIEYKTQEEIDTLAEAQVEQDKWNTLSTYLSALTVTTDAGNKFDVSPSGLANISQRVSTITEIESDTWYEDWASFTVNKVELQEALVLQAEAKKTKITELFGGA